MASYKRVSDFCRDSLKRNLDETQLRSYKDVTVFIDPWKRQLRADEFKKGQVARGKDFEFIGEGTGSVSSIAKEKAAEQFLGVVKDKMAHAKGKGYDVISLIVLECLHVKHEFIHEETETQRVSKLLINGVQCYESYDEEASDYDLDLDCFRQFSSHIVTLMGDDAPVHLLYTESATTAHSRAESLSSRSESLLSSSHSLAGSEDSLRSLPIKKLRIFSSPSEERDLNTELWNHLSRTNSIVNLDIKPLHNHMFQVKYRHPDHNKLFKARNVQVLEAVREILEHLL